MAGNFPISPYTTKLHFNIKINIKININIKTTQLGGLARRPMKITARFPAAKQKLNITIDSEFFFRPPTSTEVQQALLTGNNFQNISSPGGRTTGS
jgi:hypothetical protein